MNEDAYLLYDNETQKYCWNESFMKLPWYIDLDGQLYIFPENSAEFSPDNSVADELMSLLNRNGYLSDADIEALELEEVPYALKRISEKAGPYSA